MPEGPEIRLAADEVANALVGRTVTEIFFAFDHLKLFEAVLIGQKVQVVETYGKAMLTRFENGLNIYSHNQLYGVWMVCPVNTPPETNRQLRLAIHNAEMSALLYSASDIEVLNDDEVATHPFLSQIGPDLLDPAVTVAMVAQRLMDPAFHNKKLTTLLLDQRFVAGTGNYLRSEILFVAGVNPSLRPKDCTPIQIKELARATVALTRQSYETRGITNDLELAARLKAEGWTWRKYRWWVFNRDGDLCHRCGGLIVKDEIGGRRIYYCAGCQK
ncbi:MAG: endonuclease VIII [Caldilineaceae bacterium]